MPHIHTTGTCTGLTTSGVVPPPSPLRVGLTPRWWSVGAAFLYRHPGHLWPQIPHFGGSIMSVLQKTVESIFNLFTRVNNFCRLK